VSALEELQQVVADAAATVGPSVVAVGRGAGLVVAPDQVLTNAHNLPGRGGVHVRFADGRREDGEVVAADLDGDLAVVTVPTGDAPAATWADSGPPSVPPSWRSAPRVTDPPGRPSASCPRPTRRSAAPATAASTAPSNTPLPSAGARPGDRSWTVDGRVIGIDTHRRGDGFYLAIPASVALADRIAALRRGEAPARRHLGVAVAPADVARRLRSAVGLDDRDGVLVRHVEEDSVAARAGVLVGDLITRAGDVDVDPPRTTCGAPSTRRSESLPLHLVRGSDETR
jgi:serine protease Do